MNSFAKVLSLLLLVAVSVSGAAFLAPNARRQAGVVSANTQLKFGFLKEMGLEKPDWLPDFGGKKDEEKESGKSEKETTEDGGEPVAAAEEGAESSE